MVPAAKGRIPGSPLPFNSNLKKIMTPKLTVAEGSDLPNRNCNDPRARSPCSDDAPFFCFKAIDCPPPQFSAPDGQPLPRDCGGGLQAKNFRGPRGSGTCELSQGNTFCPRFPIAKCHFEIQFVSLFLSTVFVVVVQFPSSTPPPSKSRNCRPSRGFFFEAECQTRFKQIVHFSPLSSCSSFEQVLSLFQLILSAVPDPPAPRVETPDLDSCPAETQVRNGGQKNKIFQTMSQLPPDCRFKKN